MAAIGDRSSLERLGLQQLALGQLHWSTANYAPPQERVLWDGLVAMYDQVCCSARHPVQLTPVDIGLVLCRPLLGGVRHAS